MKPILKKVLWVLAIALIPVSLLMALGYGPHWKPFLSSEVSWVLILFMLVALSVSQFMRKNPK